MFKASVKFNGTKHYMDIKADMKLEELLKCIRTEVECYFIQLEKKDEEAGIWFEIVDDEDCDLYDGVEFRAEKVYMWGKSVLSG